VRLATLPGDHPLHKIVGRKDTSRIKTHRSPINLLLTSYSFSPSSVEKIPSAARDPMHIGKLPFSISIANDRDSSITEATNAAEDTQIFMDGSAMEGKVGAAAILLKADRPPRVLHLHLGPEKEHTVHEAELITILLGMHLLKTETHKGRTAAIAYDNQAALKAFQSNLRSPGHHIARQIMHAANTELKNKSSRKLKLTLRWTAGHEGIVENELADREAKRAAEGLTSDKHLLPLLLRKPLPINPAAIKRAHHDMLKALWKTWWKSSERGRRDTPFDEATPSKKFLNTISQSILSREDSSRIAQLRLAHVPVNQYLRCIGRADSARYPACGDESESVEHLLLRCPNYAHERWELDRQAKKQREPLTLETLLGCPEMAIPLAKYIRATGRFRT
jgi:ribonuclease HI